MKRLAALLLLLSSSAYARTVSIAGVVLDQPFATDTRPTKQTIVIPAGETGEIDITLTHPDGTAYDLTGAAMTLSVGPAGVRISRPATFTDPTHGKAKFPLVIADSISLLGTLSYDVTLTTSDGSFYRPVPATSFVVTAGIGQPGQAVTVPATQQPLAQGPAGATGATGTAGPSNLWTPSVYANQAALPTPASVPRYAVVIQQDQNLPLITYDNIAWTALSAGGGGGGGTTPTVATLLPTNGNYDEKVILTGTNLTGATAVDFNGFPVSSYTVDSATQITAHVANATTAGLVHVVTPNGTATGPSWTLSTATQSISLSLPYNTVGSGTIANALTEVLPVWLPDDVTQIRVHIANLHAGVATTTNPACSGFSAAVGTSNGLTGASIGYSGGTPTQKWTAQTLPANGGWLDFPSAGTWQPITRGSDGKVILAYVVPTGCTFFVTPAGSGGVQLGARSVSSGSIDPLPGLSYPNGSVPFDIRIEYVTAHKRVVVVGDSLAVAYDASLTTQLDQSAWWKLGPDHGYAVDDSGMVGETLAQWVDTTNQPHLSDKQLYSGAHCIVEAWVNDLAGGTAAATIEGTITSEIGILHTAGCKAIYVMAATPLSAYSTFNATRQTVLTWLRAGGIANMDGIVDADSVIASSPGASTMNASYDSGDGGHWNAAGHAVVEPLNYTKVHQ